MSGEPVALAAKERERGGAPLLGEGPDELTHPFLRALHSGYELRPAA